MARLQVGWPSLGDRGVCGSGERSSSKTTSAAPVQLILNRPVPAQDVGELGGPAWVAVSDVIA